MTSSREIIPAPPRSVFQVALFTPKAAKGPPRWPACGW